MPLTDAMIDWYIDCELDEAITPFDNDNAYIGVGNGDDSFSSSQTDLQGSSTTRVGMESDYPKRDPDDDGSSNKLRYRSEFGTSDGNYKWEEWGVFNSDSGGVMKNREVEHLGEKTDKVTWVFEVDITLTTS